MSNYQHSEIAAAGQIILLPFLAHWWVSHEQRKK